MLKTILLAGMTALCIGTAAYAQNPPAGASCEANAAWLEQHSDFVGQALPGVEIHQALARAAAEDFDAWSHGKHSLMDWSQCPQGVAPGARWRTAAELHTLFATTPSQRVAQFRATHPSRTWSYFLNHDLVVCTETKFPENGTSSTECRITH